MTIFRQSFATTRIDEAERALRQLWPMTRIQESSKDVRFSQKVAGDDAVSIGWFELGRRMELSNELDEVAVVHRLSGSFREQSVDAPDGVFLLPPGGVLVRAENATVLVVSISVAELSTLAAESVGAEAATLRFHGNLPTREYADVWHRAVEFVQHAVVGTAPALESDIVRREAFRMLMTIVLQAFPIEIVPIAVRSDAAHPGSVRRAIAFMDENAHTAITVEDVARASRLSVRGLQAAFRRELGMAPLAYLRTVRLSGAHAELLTADQSDGDTVQAIALRWGFANGGRFSRMHRDEFGESPGAALRR